MKKKVFVLTGFILGTIICTWLIYRTLFWTGVYLRGGCSVHLKERIYLSFEECERGHTDFSKKPYVLIEKNIVTMPDDFPFLKETEQIASKGYYYYY